MKKQVLFDIHVHTSPSSACSRITPSEMVEMFVQSDYSGFLLTNHFYDFRFNWESEAALKEGIDFYMTDYYAAKKAAAGRLTVLLGAEARFPDSENDYLLFGITEELIYKPDYLRLPFEEAVKILHDHHIYVAQAHPFRNNMTVKNPKLLDGLEICNGNPRHDARNAIAKTWAERFHLRRLSGSDTHWREDFGRGGMILPECPQTQHELAQMLFEDPPAGLICCGEE